ncbi:hypothetical protein Tco_0015464 [Tanacetum coccineum]
MGKNSKNKRKKLEKYQMIYFDIGPSLSTGKPLTQEEAVREALAIDICRRYSILEEERPVIETMAYSDKYKKLLDEICLDKMKLDDKIKKEEEKAIIKIKGEALIEKEDPGAFVIPIRLEAKINLNALADTCSDINVMPYRVYNDDEEDYGIQRNKFGALVYGPKPAKYLNCHDPLDRFIVLREVLNPFKKICVWKKAVSFLGSLPVALQHEDWKSEYIQGIIVRRKKGTDNGMLRSD